VDSLLLGIRRAMPTVAAAAREERQYHGVLLIGHVVPEDRLAAHQNFDGNGIT
jgi:hypothetical protein